MSVGAEAVTIAFTPSFNLAVAGLMVAFFTGFFAGIFPAIKAARSEIVSGLRQA